MKVITNNVLIVADIFFLIPDGQCSLTHVHVTLLQYTGVSCLSVSSVGQVQVSIYYSL